MKQLTRQDATIHFGDARDILPTLPPAFVHCVVTSPPYFGLRRYTSDEFVLMRFRRDVSPEDRARIIAELNSLGVEPQ